MRVGEADSDEFFPAYPHACAAADYFHSGADDLGAAGERLLDGCQRNAKALIWPHQQTKAASLNILSVMT